MLQVAFAAVLFAGAVPPAAAEPQGFDVVAEFSSASKGKTQFPGFTVRDGNTGSVSADDGQQALVVSVAVQAAKEPNCQKLAVTLSQRDIQAHPGSVRNFNAGLYACNGLPLRIALRKGGTLALTVKPALGGPVSATSAAAAVIPAAVAPTAIVRP